MLLSFCSFCGLNQILLFLLWPCQNPSLLSLAFPKSFCSFFGLIRIFLFFLWPSQNPFFSLVLLKSNYLFALTWPYRSPFWGHISAVEANARSQNNTQGFKIQLHHFCNSTSRTEPKDLVKIKSQIEISERNSHSSCFSSLESPAKQFRAHCQLNPT